MPDAASAATDVAAAILVGGQSTRMGRDKALLDIGGRPALAWVLDAARATVTGPIALVGRDPGRLAEHAAAVDPALVRITDDPRRPPCALGGIEAAIRWSPCPRVLVLACDVPLVPPALLRALLDLDADAAYALGGRGREPLLAVYAKACLPAITAAFAADRLAALGFLELPPTVRSAALAEPHQRALDPEGRAGWNMNTPADHARIARWVLQSPQGTDTLRPREAGPTMTRSMMTDHPEFAEIRYGDKVYQAPVVIGSEGEVGIDISKLRAQLGIVTLDPGYGNTGSCRSAITFIDGEKGILRYRGYPIEQLAERSTFLETSYLLLNGELPTPAEFETWKKSINHHSLLHEDIKRVYQGLPLAGPPMAVCSAVCGALSTFYDKYLDPKDEQAVGLSIVRLMAKMPTIAAWSHKYSIGQPFPYPKNHLSYAANFLQLMFSTPCEEYEINPIAARALDQLLILHADHEQNCSTSTVRIVGSSLSSLFGAISAGISALWGPLHGGANMAVIQMLREIEANDGNAQAFVAKVKDKSSGIRLMGFGHRVYKNFDPRAKIIKSSCDDLLESLGINSKLLEIAKELEQIALQDEFFISRKLYPNVDFYSGIIYQAIGIPPDMFTVMFTLGRLPGWIAQWKEMHADADFRIGRPRQIYTGPHARDYVAIDQR